MISFNCGLNINNKRKRCLNCKYFWLWGVSGGSCTRLKFNNDDNYRNADEHCKYYKRDFEIFFSDGRIKNMDLYNEMFM